MFREKDNLMQQRLERSLERAPLIETPLIFTRSHEFPMDPYRLGRSRKKQRFQWIVFFGVTLISLFLLMVLIATIIRLADKEVPVRPSAPTPFDIDVSSVIPSTSPQNIVESISTSTSTTSAPTFPPSSTSSAEIPRDMMANNSLT